MADPLAQALEASGGGNIWTILGLAVSGAMGKYAWDFYKKKADLNFKASDNVRKDVKEEKLLDRKERNEYKDDLKERVAALEVKLEAAVQAKEDLLEQVGDLRAKLAKIEADIMDAKENLGEEVCCEARLRLKSVTIVKRVCA